MIKKNIHIIIFSTLVTLFPVVTGSIVSVFLAATNLFCLLITMKDPGNQEQSPKALRLVYFICPMLSIYIAAFNYAIKSGLEFGVDVFTVILIGLGFVIIGNYLPKCKQNYTIGIKVPWAYTSEENWRRTHGFGGKVWVTGGFALMISVLLPDEIGEVLLIGGILVLVIVPTVYSYLYYRKELAEGKAVSTKVIFGKMSKMSAVFMVAVFIFVGFMMFTGDINYDVSDDCLTIEADYWDDMIVYYDRIEGVEYRDNGVSGSRTGGFGSARLLMGTFENDEFNYYTRYSYTQCDNAIVLYLPTGELVISAKSEEETKELYEQLDLKRIAYQGTK